MIEETVDRRMVSFPLWFMLLASVLISALFLPTLATPFDFSEDGCLVYRDIFHVRYDNFCTAVMRQTISEFQHTGPFRPVVWAHWYASSLIHGHNALAYRMERLICCAIAAFCFLLLLREFNINPIASTLVATLACWSTARSEIWLYHGMPEAYGMPYALITLCCAVRASRNGASIYWDVGATVFFLLCLGVKNTYVALLPALLWFRTIGGSISPTEAIAKTGFRLLFYLMPAALPFLHFILLKLYPLPTHFQTQMKIGHLVTHSHALYTAIHPKAMMAGVVFSLVVLLFTRHKVSLDYSKKWFDDPLSKPLGGAILLLSFGLAVYLPWSQSHYRYSMPAVWGADILLGLLLTAAAVHLSFFVRTCLYCVVLMGLLKIGSDTYTVQRTLTARLIPMWQVLKDLEARQPASFALVKGNGTDFYEEECFHFRFHFSHRGSDKSRLTIVPRETMPTTEFVITRSNECPGDRYSIEKQYAPPTYGRKVPGCYLWKRT